MDSMKDSPTDYNLITYVWVSVVSIAGITVHFLEMHRHCLNWSKLPDLLIDMVIAPILGIFMFYICESIGIRTVMTAGVIGLFSTFGTRGLYFLRTALIHKIFPKERDIDAN